MKRRNFIKNAVGFGLTAHPVMMAANNWGVRQEAAKNVANPAGPRTPLFVYNNWSAYDELSDHVPQTEELAMRELAEIVRLKKSGVRIDYYVMDAFWFDKWGGYRLWHKEHWPSGPARWLDGCKANNIKPGMWFSTNLIATQSGRFLEVIDEWKDSLGTDPNIMCLFDGGYLQHLSESLQYWYDKGVRLFKFDFAYFEAVTARQKDKFTKEEIKEKNKSAFIGMLRQFRERNADVLITGYNGFGGDMENTFTPFRKTVDDRWLGVFDTLYCGDPRFSDVPMMNIWRSQDNYSDHMVSQFAFNGLPLRRIDNCAFMIGTTGTCYYRALQAWKGMLILELARGGWLNVYHGNLELLGDQDAEWFARVQGLFYELQQQDGFSTFGEIPGRGNPYGFMARGKNGIVCTVVNPSQSTQTIALPAGSSMSKILYADGGFKPLLKGHALSLGAEQLVVVGFDQYATSRYDLGVDPTVRIPQRISSMEASFSQGRTPNSITATIGKPQDKTIRIIFRQLDNNGQPYRSWGGAPPDGTKMSDLLRIQVSQNGHPVPLLIHYDKMIWSGLSWGAGEVSAKDLDPGLPLYIECSSEEKEKLHLEAEIYAVEY